MTSPSTADSGSASSGGDTGMDNDSVTVELSPDQVTQFQQDTLQFADQLQRSMDRQPPVLITQRGSPTPWMATPGEIPTTAPGATTATSEPDTQLAALQATPAQKEQLATQQQAAQQSASRTGTPHEVSGGGYLAFDVPWADDSLAATVSSAAAAAGPHAALIADTARLQGTTVTVGGGGRTGRRGAPDSVLALGSDRGTGKQFGQDRKGWFTAAVESWIAEHPPPDQSARQQRQEAYPGQLTGYPPMDVIPAMGTGDAASQATTSLAHTAPLMTPGASSRMTVGQLTLGQVDHIMADYDQAGQSYLDAYIQQSDAGGNPYDAEMYRQQLLAQKSQDPGGPTNTMTQADIDADFRRDRLFQAETQAPEDASYVNGLMPAMGTEPYGLAMSEPVVAQTDVDSGGAGQDNDPDGLWDAEI